MKKYILLACGGREMGNKGFGMHSKGGSYGIDKAGLLRIR